MPAVKRIGSLLCVVALLFLGLSAASVSLHHLLHNDAGNPNHQCAVTLLAHGKIHLAVGMTAPVRASEYVAESVVPPVSVVVAVDYQLLPGRAPPFFLS
jgi:hypothetical protein